MSFYSDNSIKFLTVVSALFIMLSVTRCAGTKVLDEPVALQITQPLATNSDENIEVILDWVIVRDGPGTWARNADWDEYLLRVKNFSGQSLEVTNVVVVDSLGFRLLVDSDRGDLVDSSKLTVERYEDSEIEVKAGYGTGTMLATAAAVTAAGVAAVAATTTFGGTLGAMTVAGPSAAAVGVFIAGPAIAVGGLMRWRNNRAVNSEIEARYTQFPIRMEPDSERQLDLFFPIAPSPQMVELTYEDASGEHVIILDTDDALKGLHFGAE